MIYGYIKLLIILGLFSITELAALVLSCLFFAKSYIGIIIFYINLQYCLFYFMFV